jgi:hypothetical protein
MLPAAEQSTTTQQQTPVTENKKTSETALSRAQMKVSDAVRRVRKRNEKIDAIAH